MKTTALVDRYIRSDDFASRIDGVQLAPEVWAVFAQLHQARTTAEMASTLNLDLKAVQAAVRSLSRRKLIQKHVLDWRAYTASAAPAQATPTPAAPAPAAVVIEQRVTPITPFPASPVLSVSVSPPPAPSAPPSAPTIRFRLASDRRSSPAPVPAISLRIATAGAITPRTTTTSTSARWRLRPVLDAIGAKAGGGLAGQLLVYRVFLNVPTDLMQAGGLHSLSFVDENFVATHAPLRTAIIKAARTHAQVEVEPLLAG
jgi:hypothetical protein